MNKKLGKRAISGVVRSAASEVLSYVESKNAGDDCSALAGRVSQVKREFQRVVKAIKRL